MPWFFYGEGGVPVSPQSPSDIATGTVFMSSLPYTATPPTDYYFCNGQAISRNDNLALFALLDIQFGSGDGSTTFNLPDYRSRIPQGIINFAQGVGSVSGAGGSKTHNHAVGSHTHPIVSNHSHGMPTHVHTYGTHTHGMNSNHRHGTTGYTIGNSDSNHTNADVNELAPPPLGTDVLGLNEDGGTHRHGTSVTGSTGTVNTGFGVTTGNGANNTGSASPSLQAQSINSVSDGSSILTSTDVTQLPPYFTVSFIIKS